MKPTKSLCNWQQVCRQTRLIKERVSLEGRPSTSLSSADNSVLLCRWPREEQDQERASSSQPFLRGIRVCRISRGWVSFVGSSDKFTMTVLNRILSVLAVGFVAQAAPELHLSAPAGESPEAVEASIQTLAEAAAAQQRVRRQQHLELDRRIWQAEVHSLSRLVDDAFKSL